MKKKKAMPNPTEEQKAVMEASGRVILVNARAGTGKTTTLRLLAEKHKNRRILYLVFNRRAMEGAQKTFPANVTVRTVHGLAFRTLGHQWNGHIGHFAPADLLPAFHSDRQPLAGLTHAFLTFFMNSPHKRLEEATGPFQGLVPEGSADLYRHQMPAIVSAARQMATAWNRREKDCPHDFYLKMAHAGGHLDRELARYDLILVDEGQDLSPVILDALSRCQQRIVMAGDTHQQIYAFRFAMDAMEKLRGDARLDLTRSFRFGPAIATLATALIREAKAPGRFTVTGDPRKKSRIAFHAGRLNRPFSGTAMLSRTNLALFANAMALRNRDIPYTFERDIGPILWRALDVHHLAAGENDRIKDRFIASFSHAGALKAYAESMEDFQLLGIQAIVEKYSDHFPGIIFETAEHCRNRGSDDSEAVVLSTVHSAKGREYPGVHLDPDLAAGLNSPGTESVSPEDVNLVYVAMTRAAKRLWLAPEFKSVLTPCWKRAMARIGAAGQDPKSSRRTKTAPAPPRFARSAPPQPRPEEPELHLGDTVRTPFGRGQIVEFKGGQCLVDLEGQEARVWQRVGALV